MSLHPETASSPEATPVVQRRRAHSVCDFGDDGATPRPTDAGTGTDIENDAEPTPDAGPEMRASANETTIALLMGSAAPAKVATFKVGVFGVWSSGKTSLQRRYIDKTFSPDIQATIGNGYSTTRVRVRGDAHDSVLQIWDTAGQERFADLAEHVMRGLHAAIVVFSLTEPHTYAGCSSWISKLRSYDALLPIVLVGAKLDLMMDGAHAGRASDGAGLKRCVGRAEVQCFAQSIASGGSGTLGYTNPNMSAPCEYVETSALLDVGVGEAFARVAELARNHARALERTRSIIDEAARSPLVSIVGAAPGGDKWPDEVRIDFSGEPRRRCCA